MKATTYVSEFKRENKSEKIVQIFTSEKSENASIAVILCQEKETACHKYTAYIYRQEQDVVRCAFFDSTDDARDYIFKIL